MNISDEENGRLPIFFVEKIIVLYNMRVYNFLLFCFPLFLLKLFDLSLKLSNCNMTFTTSEFERNLESISDVQINGTYNDILYNLYITIDK